MVRPLNSTDFYLQAEGAEKIHQVKKPDPETEKKQFEKELTKQKKGQKDSASKDEIVQPEPAEEKEDKSESDSDHHIDLTA